MQDYYGLKVTAANLDSTLDNFETLANNSSQYDKNLDQKESIAAFLTRNQCLCNLNEDIIFIITSYLLKIFCITENGLPISIDFKMLQEYLSISKSQARRLVQNYQTLLSKLGSDFILEIANEALTNNLAEILPKLLRQSDENRSVLPCHDATFAILSHAIIKETPLYIIIKRKTTTTTLDYIHVLFMGNSKLNDFSLVRLDNLKFHNTPAMVVYGDVIYDHHRASESIADYMNRFMSLGLKKILLANTAMHPQYSGERLAYLRHDPYQHIMCSDKQDNNANDILPSITIAQALLNANKELALAAGCCLENQSLFYLRHVFCNTLTDQLAQVTSLDMPYYDGYQYYHQLTAKSISTN